MQGCKHNIKPWLYFCFIPGPGIRHCLSTCPVGQYANATSQSCKSCRAHCLECTNTGNYTCTRCADGTHLKGSDCVSDCGSGFYQDDATKKCIQCNERCATCEGEANRCTSCSAEFYLQGMANTKLSSENNKKKS